MGYAFLVFAIGWIFINQRFIFRPLYRRHQEKFVSEFEKDHDAYFLSAGQRQMKQGSHKVKTWASLYCCSLAATWFGGLYLLRAMGLHI